MFQLQRLKEEIGGMEKKDREEEAIKVPVIEGGGEQLGFQYYCDRQINGADLMGFINLMNESSMTWPKGWGNVDSERFSSDQSCTTVIWWDVWSSFESNYRALLLSSQFFRFSRVPCGMLLHAQNFD